MVELRVLDQDRLSHQSKEKRSMLLDLLVSFGQVKHSMSEETEEAKHSDYG